MFRNRWQRRLSLALVFFIALHVCVLMYMHSRVDASAQKENVAVSPKLVVMPPKHVVASPKQVVTTPNQVVTTPKRPNEPRPPNPPNHDVEESIHGVMNTSVYAKPSSSYTVDPSDLWEDPSAVLPKWMKDYFRWHKEEHKRLMENPEKWSDSHRYLFVACLHNFPKCGGFADRLMSLPFLVKVAAESNRLLFIKWGRPAELEEFLLPPLGGLDWRMPSWLFPEVEKAGRKATDQDLILEIAPTKVAVLRVKFQSHDHGLVFYDKNRRLPSEPTFQEVFRGLWNVLFTPVEPIASKIENCLQENGLVPDLYGAVHIRALYNAKERDPELVASVTKHAIDCSSTRNGGPIFFAADTALAVEAAADYGADRNIFVVAARQGLHESDPLHLDKAKDWPNRKPAEFYDTFVDFYVLSQSRCVMYGMGGYGKMASFLSFNASCGMQHHNATAMTKCEFTKHLDEELSDKEVETPLFPLPMPPLVEAVLSKKETVPKEKTKQ
jgi:hypothetical protein